MNSIDALLYALLKKQIRTSSTGIAGIQLSGGGDEEYKLSFQMGDGSTIDMALPIKTDCIDLETVTGDSLPENPSKTSIYLLENEDGILEQWVFGADNKWHKIGEGGTPLATTEKAGLVLPDDDSIVVDEKGVVSISLDYLKNTFATYFHDITDEQIQSLFEEEEQE